jgi:imidazolonepropionase-like amidohydrolase
LKSFIALLALLTTTVAAAQDLAITHATVYASPTAAPTSDTTVVIKRGVISQVGQQLQIPKDIPILSCNGCVVLAGFWNAHVHFMEPKWNDAAHQPTEKLAHQITEMLTHSGFTTVVDTGSDGENTVALRRRVESGEAPGPRIFTAGAPIFPAHALPYYVAGLPQELLAKMGQPETPEQAVAFVEKNRLTGSDILKLFTGSIVRPDHIVPMKEDIAQAAVNEAHRHGQLVFSHSTNLEGTRVAIDARVDVLAHTPEATEGIDGAMLQRMHSQGMTIISTLKLFAQDGTIAKIRALDHHYHELGGRLVYGTDTGFLPDYDQAEEFRQLAASGFNFRDVLAMLTTAPAELFHLSQTEGKVIPGMRADLTILSTDPATGKPEAFTDVRYTIRAGKIIWQSK